MTIKEIILEDRKNGIYGAAIPLISLVNIKFSVPVDDFSKIDWEAVKKEAAFRARSIVAKLQMEHEKNDR